VVVVRRDVYIYLYALSIQKQKAFNNIRHDPLIPILQETDINEKDIRIIHKLYWNQRKPQIKPFAKRKNENYHRNSSRMHHSYLISTWRKYFSWYLRVSSTTGSTTGIKVNGISINNLWYANDTAILAENIQKLP